MLIDERIHAAAARAACMRIQPFQMFVRGSGHAGGWGSRAPMPLPMPMPMRAKGWQLRSEEREKRREEAIEEWRGRKEERREF